MVSNSPLPEGSKKQSIQRLLKTQAIFLIKLCASSRATFLRQHTQSSLLEFMTTQTFNET